LATIIDARVHYAVLKIRAAPRQNPPHPRRAVTVRENKPSQARSLRTQQRARPAPRRPRRSGPPRGAVLDRDCRVTSRITRCPQMSCHPETLAQDMALGTGPVRPAPGAP
jgi:hypothetical protein